MGMVQFHLYMSDSMNTVFHESIITAFKTFRLLFLSSPKEHNSKLFYLETDLYIVLCNFSHVDLVLGHLLDWNFMFCKCPAFPHMGHVKFMMGHISLRWPFLPQQ